MYARLISPVLAVMTVMGVCSPVAEARKPNIVVILADDLGIADLDLYDGWLPTPNLARMAGEGMVFTDFHANSSVCTPTRAAFLTGRYQQRIGIVDVLAAREKPDHGLPTSTTTIAEVLKQGGYTTGLVGKWHLGYKVHHNPLRHGFDEFFGFLSGGADYHEHSKWRDGLKLTEVHGYSTDIITEKSIDFIDRHQHQPFFLYVAHQTPHNPYQTRADTPDKRPDGWRQNRVDEVNRPRYREMVKDLDDSVGAILDKLRSTGLSRHTLVFFWSDNGDVRMAPIDRPLRGGKFSHYEGGHRVPAIAWWPGKVPNGTTCDALLAGFDLFPTFTELAGLEAATPDNLDGISAAGVMLEQKPFAGAGRDLFFGYEPKLGTALRRGNLKMIVKGGEAVLYDLARDPRETVIINGREPKTTESMQAAIERFKRTVIEGS